MDKGYDSEAIHRLIRDDLHADLIIPIRSWNNDVVGGTYHQEMALQFDDVRFRKRQLVENKFFVLKRNFSGDLKARIFAIQKKEITGKKIVFNIHRFLQFLVIEVFYRAQNSLTVSNLDPAGRQVQSPRPTRMSSIRPYKPLTCHIRRFILKLSLLGDRYRNGSILAEVVNYVKQQRYNHLSSETSPLDLSSVHISGEPITAMHFGFSSLLIE